MSGRPRYTLEGAFPNGKLDSLSVYHLVSRPTDETDRKLVTSFWSDDKEDSPLKFIYEIASYYYQLMDKKKPEPTEGGTLILKSWLPKLEVSPPASSEIIPPTVSHKHGLGIGLIGFGGWPRRTGELEVTDQWTMTKAFPSSFGFGDDYSDDPIIEVTWEFHQISYQSMLPTITK